ncbi:MAG: winged helix-turn-helix transcriptional regulator [Candidatus Methanomethyliales bacterium]|nr:winged helix-turn-helix transcriptional regulator [Candidatus Methanomethylicales archaeon]
MLEQKSACRVLVYLLENDSSTISDILNKGDFSQTSLYNALRKLKDADLIQEELEKEFPRRRLISLTEKGKKVAEKLEEIEKLL